MAGLINFLASVGAPTVTDSGLSEALRLMQEVVDTALIIIYVVLGMLLVIKGALLGMQIVKAADEPQIRQEKIGSLKWLVIGVAIAYAVTFIADILTGYLWKLLAK